MIALNYKTIKVILLKQLKENCDESLTVIDHKKKKNTKKNLKNIDHKKYKKDQ